MTSKYNAGFKKAQRTETLLLLMLMEIQKNMREGKPSYIIGFDVKGGYNNVNLAMLKEKFEEVIVPVLKRGNSERYVEDTKKILDHIIDNPRMKIWQEVEGFSMSQGV